MECGAAAPEPGVAYEDYQRDIRRFQERHHHDRSSLTRSLPDLDADDRAAIRVSHIAQIGGFRREFLHRQASGRSRNNTENESLEAELAPEASPEPEPAPQEASAVGNVRMLAYQIDEHMRSLVFFFGAEGSCYESTDGGGLFEEPTTRELRSHCQSVLSEEHAPAGAHRKLSVGKACASAFKAFIGTGILFVPQGAAGAGWASAVAMLMASAMISTVGIIFLGQCHQVCPRPYPEMGREAFGVVGYSIISFQIALSQFSFTTTFIVFISSTVHQLCRASDVHVPPSWAVVGVTTLLFIPLGWIRRIGKMRIPTLIGDVIIVFAVLYVFVSAAVLIGRNGPSPAAVPWGDTKPTLRFVGTAIYSFEGIALVIPIRESMHKPRLFPYVLTGMMALFAALIASIGALGYVAWGPRVDTVILNELPGAGGKVVQMLYMVAVLFSFPLLIYPTFSICEAQLFSGMLASTRRKLLKNAFRSLVTIAMGILAYAVDSNLSIFVSMVGSVCCIPLAITLPAMLHMRIIGVHKWFNWLMALFGACLTPLTFYIDSMTWGGS